MNRTTKLSAVAGALGLLWLSPALAAESMEGRTITIYSAVGAGGGYDAYGRMLARSIGQHIPGKPNVVAGNMVGGGGRKLGNFMYGAAPKDGSAIAILQHTTVYDAAFGEQGVRYDATKFGWLGSMASVAFVGFAWHTTGVKTLEDARTIPISLGATGPGATSGQYPALLNNMFGTKIKIVNGYKGSAEIYHAVEQRELDGTGGLAWEALRNSYPQWIRENRINIFVQYAMQRHPELPNVPLIHDFARNADEKQVLQFIFAGLQFARPFLVPPDVPQATLDMLRAAMDAALKDPELIAESKKRKFDLDPTDGPTVQRLVAEVYNAPPALKERAKKLLIGN